VKLTIKDNSATHWMLINDSGAFRAVVDLLRNEKPLFYIPASETISTGIEPIGENDFIP
jgi:hypothetical protein